MTVKEQFEYIVRGSSVRTVEPRARFSADELDRFLREVQCDDVTINQLYSMTQAELDQVFLSEGTRHLSIVMDQASLSALLGNGSIQSLYFSGRITERFDFACAKELRRLNLVWQKAIGNLAGMPSLTELTLSKYAGSVDDLRAVSTLEAIRLIEPKIRSIEFVEGLQSLRSIALTFARSVRSIEPLASRRSTLRELELERLPKLVGYEKTLAQLKDLSVLKLTRCPPIPSLAFVRSMKNLEHLSFVDTDIEDGDLSPCVGVKYVGFLDKARYNFFWDGEHRRLVRK